MLERFGGEARDEGKAGQLVVAWTIRNRVEWMCTMTASLIGGGEGYAGVCLTKYQFRRWNKTDTDYPFLSGANPIPAAHLARARRTADQMIIRLVPDPSGGATHYYVAAMKKPPVWSVLANRTAKIGAHVFVKDAP